MPIPPSSFWFLVVMILATARLTSLITTDDGPSLIFERLRNRLGLRRDAAGGPVYRDGSFQQLLACDRCAGLWVALGSFLTAWWFPESMLLFLPLAIAQGALLVLRHEV